MQDQIIIIATLKLIDNKLEELTEVINDLQAHCINTEKGMLQYDWYVSEESDFIKVLETYTNSDAVLFHFDNYKPFVSRMNDYRSFVSLEVYGNASPALRNRVQKINAQHFKGIAFLHQDT